MTFKLKTIKIILFLLAKIKYIYFIFNVLMLSIKYMMYTILARVGGNILS